MQSLVSGENPRFNEFTYQLCELLLFRKYRPNPCNAGSTTLAIAADGDIYPCHRFVGYEEFKVGNVNDADPLSEAYGQITRSFKEISVDANPHCSQCWVRYMCGGNCYVISWLREADVFKPPESGCHFRKSIFERLLAEFSEVMCDAEKRRQFMANVKNYYAA